jgi:nitrogen PTS system EIIA component
MRMADLVSVGRMIPRLRARDKSDVLRKLAGEIERDAGVSSTAILKAVSQSADLPACGPELGVALAHALIPDLRRPLATVARLQPAVDFGAADGSLTDLVVLLLSPRERPGDHLRALASIARRLRNPAVGTSLRASKGRDSMYMLFVGSELEDLNSTL